MRWWGWVDLLGRLLLLVGLFLQLDALEWFQTQETNSYLSAVLENQGTLALALQNQDFTDLYLKMESLGETLEKFARADEQQTFASQFNLAMVGFGSLLLMLARYCELRHPREQTKS